MSIRIGSNSREEMEQLAKKYFDSHGHLREEAIPLFDQFLSAAAHLDSDFRCYQDALDYVVDLREGILRRKLVEEKYTDSQLDTLLDTQLYPYQKEGIRFAATAGRAIIADEMGLGKTIQAIGTAELLRREGFAENVLVVCPTSLKYQWKREIERFTHREVLVIEGLHTRRREQYTMPQPYKIVSYNSVCNDLKVLKNMETDMVMTPSLPTMISSRASCRWWPTMWRKRLGKNPAPTNPKPQQLRMQKLSTTAQAHRPTSSMR